MVARCVAEEGKRDPRFEARLRECLRRRGDPRRILAACYFLEVSVPTPPPSLAEFWAHIEAENDPVVVEGAPSRWVGIEAYTGDPRMLVALRRVVGIRQGRPMIAVALLSELVLDAEKSIHVHHHPEALVAA